MHARQTVLFMAGCKKVRSENVRDQSDCRRLHLSVGETRHEKTFSFKHGRFGHGTFEVW